MQRIKKVLCFGSLLILSGCQTNQVGSGKTFTEANNSSHAVYLVESQFSTKLYDNSVKLKDSFATLCRDTSSRNHLDATRLYWQKTMQSWMALQGQQRGPEQALEQSWKIQFWPDKKNTTGRKVRELIKQDKDWTQSEIATQSVAVQGLGSLEWLLYDRASSIASDELACELGYAVSQNLVTKTQLVKQAWGSNPWQVLSDKAWLTVYVSLLSHQLDYTIKKLSLPIAKIGHPKPYFAESWRSQTSMINIKANIEAMEKLYKAGLEQRLRQHDADQLADSISEQFFSIIELWPENPSLFQLLQTRQGYQSVLNQFNKLEQLRYLIQDEAAVKLGITIGFNATDGD
ncbi:imelysin family protein [Vibrio marisflavi]|uniref:Imelysin-like domain-containing protein n=1 Tax=Vibrio marisflavi CECT 7928 TaxID=634439 RepID=A0ABM9A686_9VIBR|nr:imelysin family protein [Vibrio marisflavi]CAH0540790.1 hypothetical protein VMF7928_03124 [Vibrio marisflavi CECT 7928]